MNHNVESSRQFLESFFNQISNDDLKRFMFFPPALLAQEFAQYSAKGLRWGAQNFYAAEEGAFTGENSPRLYQQMGAEVMLIGHSERRSLFAETDGQIQQKIEKCTELNLVPVLCVGETLEQRQAGDAEVVIKSQLLNALGASITEEGLKIPASLVIAYEPVWAIGTGQVASVDDVKKMHDFIKDFAGSNTPVLYGGSVKPENAAELFAIESVNGFLIGGASLKCESLLSIFNIMKDQAAQSTETTGE